VGSLETKIDETEQKFEEMKKAREEWLKKATDAESKINELTNTMQRLVLSTYVIFFYLMHHVHVLRIELKIVCSAWWQFSRKGNYYGSRKSTTSAAGAVAYSC
jgi:hypothetical protein